MIYRKIVKLDVFSLQNVMLHFEICESSGSKYAVNNGHSSNATAASNLSFLLKAVLNNIVKSLECDISFRTIFRVSFLECYY